MGNSLWPLQNDNYPCIGELSTGHGEFQVRYTSQNGSLKVFTRTNDCFLAFFTHILSGSGNENQFNLLIKTNLIAS